MTEIPISEAFYSVQAEGVTSGVPAYFIRTLSCNLLCGNPDLTKVDDTTDQKQINEQQADNATWTCDTISVWLHGAKQSYEEILDGMREEDELDSIMEGNTHIIWTGGEPTMHQEKIADFIAHIKDVYNAKPYNELETNGTVYINDKLFEEIDQINCSPKLANSGMPEKRRIKPKALERIMEHDNYWLKFVITEEQDIEEIERDYINAFNVDKKRVVLMPGVQKEENIAERTRFLYEMAKKYHYRGVTRGHILAWDQTTGV